MRVDQEVANNRNLQFLKYSGVAIFFSILIFSVTAAVFSGSKSISLSLVQPEGASSLPVSTATSSGMVALTESELISAVKATGSPVYWIGPSAGAKYAFNHLSEDQNFIRYLPGGTGIEDLEEKYRIIATYKDPTAYETIQKASKSDKGVTITNRDGSMVYYLKASPLHVYLVFKNLDYQIEIFDPTPGEALKLGITSDIFQKIK